MVKFKKYTILFSVLLMFLLSLVGCSNIEDTLSQKEAEQLVIEKHTNDNGTPTIISTKVKNNTYHIKWENKGNKEEGTDKVDENGKVTMIDAKIE